MPWLQTNAQLFSTLPNRSRLNVSSVSTLVSGGTIYFINSSLGLQFQLGVACTALATYEYLITFDYEFSVLWGHRVSATSMLFLINRLFLLVPLTLLCLPPVSWKVRNVCDSSQCLQLNCHLFPYPSECFQWRATGDPFPLRPSPTLAV